MSISVKSRIHRKMRGVDQFKSCDSWEQLPQLGKSHPELADTEVLLGAYENVPGGLDHLLLFTNLGVHFRQEDNWRSLEYAEVENCQWPQEGKSKAHMLVIQLRSGAIERLPILGGTELTRDLFAIMGFLEKVAHDIRSGNIERSFELPHNTSTKFNL